MIKKQALRTRLLPAVESKEEVARNKKLEALFRAHKGNPFVFDDGRLRFMYFNKKSIQSAMNIDTPDKLICGYTTAMMAFLMDNPAPKKILMVGLGGGSLVKFCYRHLPESHITVVEIEEKVIALRDQFMIPHDDERLTILHQNALDFFNKNTLQFDVILLDGFDCDGLVLTINTARFYGQCEKALTSNGILITNMWGSRPILVDLLTQLRVQFKQQVWWCKSLDSYNLLTFSFKANDSHFHSNLMSSAKALDERFQFQFELLQSKLCTLQLKPSIEYEENELLELNVAVGDIMSIDNNLPNNDTNWSAANQCH